MPYKIFKTKSRKNRKFKNIALIDVGRTESERQSHNENQYNLALGYIGAMLLKEGYNVMILQENPNKDKQEDLIDSLINFSPDILSYTSFSYQFKNTLKFKKLMDKKINNTKILSILGGIHASTSPENSVKYFDYLIFSEGEETFKELLQFLNKEIKKKINEIKGLHFLDKNKKMTFTGVRKRVQDLDKYGDPLRLFFNLDDCGMVTPIPDGVTGFAPLTFSRGCVRACSFCTNKLVLGCGKKARVTRKPEKIAKEIERLYHKHNINYFYAHDEDYTYDAEFMGEVCDVLIDYKKKKKIGQIYFAGMGSIGSFYNKGKVDKKLIKKFAKAGCIMVALGIERVTDTDLNKIHKGTNLKEIMEVTQAMFNNGIAPIGLFISALQGDTKKELEFMIHQAIKIPAIRCRFALAYPLKGTDLRKNLHDDAWIDTKFKKDEYATCEFPVLKTAFCKNINDKGYEYLLNFEKKAQRKIYSSEEYAKGIKKFKKVTGKRFKKFFAVTWKEIIREELGDIDLKW